MSKFFTDPTASKEYKFRCLIYPNITFQKDFYKDSFYIIMSNILKHLTKLRPDIHFTILTPEIMPGFQYESVEQVLFKWPTYPNEMRQHFDTFAIKKVTDYKTKDWDFVYSYLPEHTLLLENHFYNTTNQRPVFFGYSPYIEIPKTTKYDSSLLRNHYAGLMSMNTCGVTSEAVKDTIIENAKLCLPDSDIEKLKDIILAMPRGWDNVEGPRKEAQTDPKIIVFNHRPDTYKHFNHFISLMDKLWEQRKDFKVWVPLSDINKDYTIKIKEKNKQAYYNKLQKCCVGFSPKQKYGGWSVATTDGMMNGCPYIMYNDTYYHELNPNADFFKTDDEALLLLNSYLDTDIRNKQARKALDHVKSVLIYKDEVIKMSNYMNELLDKQKVMGDSHKLKEIVEFIKQGPTTKKQLMESVGWGRGIKWTPYRRALMKHPNSFDIRGAEPIYKW